MVHEGIYPIVEKQLEEYQFDFRNRHGTRRALLRIQVLIHRARDVNTDIFLIYLEQQLTKSAGHGYSQRSLRIKHRKKKKKTKKKKKKQKKKFNLYETFPLLA